MKQVILVGYTHEDVCLAEEFDEIAQCLKEHSFSIALECPKGFGPDAKIEECQERIACIEDWCSEVNINLDDLLNDTFDQKNPEQVKLARQAKRTFSLGVMLEKIKEHAIPCEGVDDAQLLEAQSKIDINLSLEEFKEMSLRRSAKMAQNITDIVRDEVVAFVGIAHLADIHAILSSDTRLNLRCLCFSNKPGDIPRDMSVPIERFATIMNTNSEDNIAALAITSIIVEMRSCLEEKKQEDAVPDEESISSFGI